MSIYLAKADLNANLYPDIVNAIIREQDEIVEVAIATSIATAKMYLTRYDLDALFGIEAKDETPAVAPTVEDAMLKGIVRDLTAWQICKLASVGIDMIVVKEAYEAAMRLLRDIQSGKGAPIHWPYLETSTRPEPPDGDAIAIVTREKRNNYF